MEACIYRGRGVLCICAVFCLQGVYSCYTVSLVEFIDVASYVFYDSGHLIALVDFYARDEMVRSLPIPRIAGTVDDLDQQLVRAWLGYRDIYCLTSERVCLDNYRFHCGDRPLENSIRVDEGSSRE